MASLKIGDSALISCRRGLQQANEGVWKGCNSLAAPIVIEEIEGLKWTEVIARCSGGMAIDIDLDDC